MQKRLRAAIVAELERMRVPDDGRHLSRFARSLVHEAIAALLGAGLPKPVAAHIIATAARKAFASQSESAVPGGLGQLQKLGQA